MSYILDALKKAESERKLGSVPDVYAQPAASLALEDQRVLKIRPWAWGVLLVLLAVLAAIAWIKPWRIGAAGPAAPRLPLENPVPRPQPISAPTAFVQAAPLPQNAAISNHTSAPDLTVAVKSATLPVPPARSPIASSAEPVEIRSGKSTENARQPATPSEIPQVKKATAPSAPEIRIPTMDELPEMIQKEIPTLTFGGYLYSSKPADRTVLINNRLLHEGDQVAPGLTLEKMMPQEAVLNYSGYRYRVSY